MNLPLATPCPSQPPRLGLWLGALALVAGVVALYAPTLGFEFVGFDDEEYVSDNPWVRRGLSADSVRWALTAFHSGNWHPLTWLSHMVDCQLFGLRAGWHHLTGFVVHALSAVVLFLWLTRLTGLAGRSFLVAALFAVHPLRAESVAWISERKDVLAVLLGLLALAAYTRYARGPSLGRYLVLLALLGLGLSAKPLLVTLPCVMLLLDYWPLGRLGRGASAGASQTSGQGGPLSADWLRRGALLVVEKLPLFALAAASSAVTVQAQRAASAVSSLSAHPLSYRAGYAVLAYGAYLKKFFWPSQLMFMYPHPVKAPSLIQVAEVGALLLAITGLALWQSRRHPYLIVGWLWFLGTLVPNIGLVQVGAQFIADRFTYLSGIGLAWAVVWSLADSCDRISVPKGVRVALAGVYLGALMLAARPQIATWRNTESLVEHALAIDPQNHVAHRIWGSVLADQGQYAEAIAHYQQAREVGGRPLADTLTLLADALSKTGELPAALDVARQAVAARPDLAEAHRTLGKLLGQSGRWDLALEEFQRAVQCDSTFALAQADLAVAQAELGRLDEAEKLARRAVELRPGSAHLLTNWGALLLRQGRVDQAERACRQAVSLEPQRPEAQYNLGLVEAVRQRWPEALVHLREALRLRPGYAEAEYDLGRVLAAQGEYEQAVTHFERACQLRPQWTDPMNYLAWLHATERAPWARPERAVALAESAVALGGRQAPELLDTLAAAYAAVGNWDQACRAAQEALERARQSGAEALATDIQGRLERYQRREPLSRP